MLTDIFTLNFLQVTWFILIAVLLTIYAVLDGFDLGVGFWYLFAKDNKEQIIVLNTIRPFWDGNEVWLLTGGGAIFAAFPPVYATVFSGFYLALMLVLCGLIFRAVGIDFRDKIDSVRWRTFFGTSFALGSILPALLFGVAVGNIVRGLPMDGAFNYKGSFFDLLNCYALVVGITGLLMIITHGGLYLLMKSESGLKERLQKGVGITGKLFFVLNIITGVWSLFYYHRETFLIPLIIFFLSVVAIATTLYYHKEEKRDHAFYASVLSIVLTCAATGALLFPYLVPAPLFMGEGLSIFNASSSAKTLMIMLIMALIGVPIVIGYTIFLYRVFKGKVTTPLPL